MQRKFAGYTSLKLILKTKLFNNFPHAQALSAYQLYSNENFHINHIFLFNITEKKLSLVAKLAGV